MRSAIQFYFDFSSPYGYFAATGIEALAARYEREIDWHPVLLGAVFKTTGMMPLTTIPIKGEYAMHDIARTARFHAIDYQHPSLFPVSTQVAARAMLWLQSTVGKEKAVQFAKKVYRAYFVEGLIISDPEVVVRLGVEVAAELNFGTGPDGEGFAEQMAAGMASESIKDLLKEQVVLAMKQGVFGSPYIVVDGEPFWGFDRFDQLEALLRNGKI